MAASMFHYEWIDGNKLKKKLAMYAVVSLNSIFQEFFAFAAIT